MSNIIRIKRKAASGSTDGPSSLANAELAYNERTNILYYGWGTEGDNGTATQVVPIAGSGYVLDQIATNAPTKTGGGASGTWNISITGNAATVTNGVYTTGNQIIQGSLTASGIFVSGANRAIGNISNNNLFLLTNNSTRVTIANNGSVGIGQTPDQTFRLDVLGPTRMVGTTTFSSSGNSPNNIALNVNMLSGGPDSTFSVTGDGNVFISGDISAYGNISTSGDLEANVITSEHLNSDSIDCHGSMSVGANQTIGGSLTVASGLTVNGTTTIINTTNLQVQDKNIELGKVNDPTNSTANGGGITLLGDTSKTIIWSDDNWTSSENWNIQSNKSYKINNVSVLTSASVGNTNTDWGGTIIPVAKGGTGASSLTGVVIGNGTGAMTAASGTANQLLRRNSTNTAYEFFTHDFYSTSNPSGYLTQSTLCNAFANCPIDGGTF